MAQREIYPNPPLVLTVIELRHTETSPLSEADQAALKTLLAAKFPLARPVHRLGMTLTSAGVTQENALDPRYMTRDNTSAVTFRRNGIVVETTRYERRSTLRELLRLAVEARQKVASADGIVRLGVRYVNEIRADIESPSDWSQWIVPALTSGAALEAGSAGHAMTWQGVSVFGSQENGVALRHGNHEGYAVDPGSDLRRAPPPPGPFTSSTSTASGSQKATCPPWTGKTSKRATTKPP